MTLSWAQRAYLLGKTLTGSWDLKPGSSGEKLLRGIFPAAVGAPPTRGTQAHLQGYSSMPWVRAVAGRVGYSVSATTWRLYANKAPIKNGQKRLCQACDLSERGCCVQHAAKQRTDIQFAGAETRKQLIGQIKDTGELTEITSHPMLDLLNNGNILHSGMELRKIAQIHRDLVGETFWLKERGALKKPTAMWPIPPQWIISTPTPSSQEFRVSFRGWQGYIPATEILWFKDSDPAMPYWRGSGTAQALSDELETDEYAAKHLKQFFYNHARPDVIISPKGDLNSFGAGEMDRLDESWNQQHGGFWRAFKPMFSSRPLEVTSFPQNFQHLQLSDLRKSVRDICLQVWGVPPEILGILEHSNRATIDAADYLFSKWVIVPRLEAWRLDYQRQLVPEFDERLIVDYDSPVQEDTAFRGTIMSQAPWAFEADEIREVAGLAPLDDEQGKFHMEPSAMTRVRTWEETAPKPVVTTPVEPKSEQLVAAFSKLTDAQLLDLAVKMAEPETVKA